MSTAFYASYFEEITQYVSGLSNDVSLYLCGLYVAGWWMTNKAEGICTTGLISDTGTNEILASNKFIPN